jgi:uncharacterized protein YcbX
MLLGRIVELWRYPVKSMNGVRLREAELSTRGIPGDRGWAVHDEERGGVTNAKRLPGLRACAARYLREPVAGEASPDVEITLPGGERVLASSPVAAERLSASLGRRLSLRSLGPVGSDAAPRVQARGESPETLRQLMGVIDGEPLPDLSALSPERLAELRRGNFFDALPVHLLTTTTLRTLERIAPSSVWDRRRFRPNFLVEANGAAGYPELGWGKRRLRLGRAVIELVMGCPRCSMVTQPVDELPGDPGVMRTLVRETKHLAGVYASVVEEGAVREGDEVAAID